MKLLLLAGTGEAREIARGLATIDGIEATASLAGATRQPARLELPTRIGGFGGRQGFEEFLTAQNIEAVLDATHPFASRISARTADVCTAAKVPYCQFLRPRWEAGEADQWTFLDHEADAAGHIPPGANVFLATGVQTLEGFANLTGRRLWCRRIDRADGAFPFPNGEWLVGRPPFSVADEVALFQDLQIDWLVVKNSGGQASRSKLDAARQLGLQVALINRPTQPDGRKVQTVSEALRWVQGLT